MEPWLDEQYGPSQWGDIDTKPWRPSLTDEALAISNELTLKELREPQIRYAYEQLCRPYGKAKR